MLHGRTPAADGLNHLPLVFHVNRHAVLATWDDDLQLQSRTGVKESVVEDNCSRRRNLVICWRAR
jgi:hypothetical protein